MCKERPNVANMFFEDWGVNHLIQMFKYNWTYFCYSYSPYFLMFILKIYKTFCNIPLQLLS